MPVEDTVAEPPWRAGVRGAKATAVPGLVLQTFALALVIAYYHVAAVHEAVTRLADYRQSAGVWFSMLSTGLFGGAIPFLYLKARSATRRRYSWAAGATLVAFWSYKGFEVDLLYRVMASTIGEGTDFRTIAIKTVLDQFVYCPLIAVPPTVLLLRWIESGFSGRSVAADIAAGNWYRRRVLPVLISNLAVWLPAVCIIYSLPTPLQLPLQNLVLCFFSLLLAHVVPARRPASE